MTAIEWTDVTWNPVRGCSRVSAGCENCYAERQAARFAGPGMPYEGLVRRAANGEARWTGKLGFYPHMLGQPLRWSKPRRVFVNSMSDLFHSFLSDDVIAAVFAVMAASPQHTFQILTKRPERMRVWFELMARDPLDRLIDASESWMELRSDHRIASWSEGALHAGLRWPLPNVWLGVSVEDQKTADERIPHLLATPAAVRFVSYEPALGPVDFAGIRIHDAPSAPFSGNALHTYRGFRNRIDWVIVGGESGPGARPFDLAWARSTVEQCKAAGVACFVKQLGAKQKSTSPVPNSKFTCTASWTPRDRKGGDMAEWPEDLRVRQWPEAQP